MELQEGYYWVKIHDEWSIGEYLGDYCGWIFINILEAYRDSVEFEIGERLEPPKDS